MKKLAFLIITSLWICSNVNSQDLTSTKKTKIASEIDALFEKSIKAAETLDVSGLTESVSDVLLTGFISQGVYYKSFETLMDKFNSDIRGIESQKMNISNKKITVLSDSVALLTTSGNYSVELEDGRVLTGGFAWTFVYSKVDGKWKIIHSHQ